jgi:hypothetical protein
VKFTPGRSHVKVFGSEHLRRRKRYEYPPTKVSVKRMPCLPDDTAYRR